MTIGHLVLIATSIAVFFWVYARYKLSYWKRRGVESLEANLIFGNFKDAVLFRSAPGWHLGQLHKAARPDAPFVGFYIFHKPCLLLRDLIGCAVCNALLIFSLFLTAFYFWMKWKHTYWQRRGIRSLPTHWLFGHFKDAILMRNSPAVILGELYQQANCEDDVLGIYILHKPFLLVRNPELIKQIMIKDFHVFPNHHFTAKSKSDTIGEWSLFSIDNPKWKYLRTKMSPVFTSGKLKSIFLLMEESGEKMRNHLRDQFTSGSKISINVKDTFYKYTTDIISSVAFGIRMNCFDPQEPEFYKNSCLAFQVTFLRAFRFFILFFLPDFGKYLGNKILGDYTDYFRKVFWDSMDNRSVTKKKQGDLIDSLLQLKNEPDDAPFRFEGDALVAQAAIFFVAGREASITTMTYTLCELAKHPEMQKRIRQEILEKIEAANGAVTYDAVHEMKYLHQVINETLRLYPPAPILDRVPITEYTFPNTKITIEKGTPVYVALRGLHTDPRYFSDPTSFDPERFSDERKNEIVPCTYLPFGEGPRNCIGMRLGNLQTAVGLITILRDYEVSLNPEWLITVDKRNVFTTPPPGFLLDLKKP